VKIEVFKTKADCSQAAADRGTDILKQAISVNSRASFIVATGASQFDLFESLTEKEGIDWRLTTMYHLDEYIGMHADHPASFRRYLRKRLVDIVHPGTVHFIEGEAHDPAAECQRINQIISQDKIAVAFVGIGENGHLAFNDPPADFDTEEPYIIVELDEACRQQQFGEGWFASLDEVPNTAISMSIQQIMKSEAIICTVPNERKALAVKQCFEGEISPMHPASILRRHPNAVVYLDEPAASLLSSIGGNRL
jgi:glucosamine-6-phosphate deaminase